MFRLRLTIDCQPRTKNGQPHQSTTGVASTSSIQIAGRDARPARASGLPRQHVAHGQTRTAARQHQGHPEPPGHVGRAPDSPLRRRPRCGAPAPCRISGSRRARPARSPGASGRCTRCAGRRSRRSRARAPCRTWGSRPACPDAPPGAWDRCIGRPFRGGGCRLERHAALRAVTGLVLADFRVLGTGVVAFGDGGSAGGLVCGVVLRVGAELLLAVFAAEVVAVSVILSLMSSGSGIHSHAAYRILHLLLGRMPALIF